MEKGVGVGGRGGRGWGAHSPLPGWRSHLWHLPCLGGSILPTGFQGALDQGPRKGPPMWTLTHHAFSGKRERSQAGMPRLQRLPWVLGVALGSKHPFSVDPGGRQGTPPPRDPTRHWPWPPCRGAMSSGAGAPTCAESHQSCQTVRDRMDRSPPGSSVQGILQARILEGVAVPSSRGSSWRMIPGGCGPHRPTPWAAGW